MKPIKTHPTMNVLAAGIGALLLALASGNPANAQSNTGTGPSPGPQFPATSNGTNALIGNTTGTSNSAYGFDALRFNATGAANSAFGAFALRANTGGINNVAIGQAAMQFNTTGNANSALGVQALNKNTTGFANNAFGNVSLGANTTGNFNTAVGPQSLRLNTTGTSNSAIGYQALSNCTTGGFNTAVGDGALLNTTTGSGNIALGDDAGINLTTGNNNIYIGNPGAPAGTESGYVRIGRAGMLHTVLVGIIHGDGSGLTGVPTTALTGTITNTQIAPRAVNSTSLAVNLTLSGATTTITGNLGVGTDTPATELEVVGEITCTALNIASDRNAKEGFKPVNPREVLEKVARLPITEWQYKTQPDARHIGPMAQDFHAAFSVGRDERHISSVDENGVALAAIQGLNEKLTEQMEQTRAENAKLKESVRELKSLVEKLARQSSSHRKAR